MTTTASNKRPGRCSNTAEPWFNPIGDQEMNKRTDITSARPSPEQIVSAMRDLETPIRDLRVMANIMAERLEDSLTDSRVRKGERRPDNDWHIELSNSEMNVLAFCWSNVCNRAGDLEKAWESALRGEEAPL